MQLNHVRKMLRYLLLVQVLYGRLRWRKYTSVMLQIMDAVVEKCKQQQCEKPAKASVDVTTISKAIVCPHLFEGVMEKEYDSQGCKL